MPQPLTFHKTLSLPFEIAIEGVTAALKAEGFGVLTTIDVKATLKNKLDVDFRPYMILGACNPSLAHRALENEPDVGALLPCNVTVEATKTGAKIAIINPEAMLGLEPLKNNLAVKEIALEARKRLERVLASL
jgi:uncharacterized protein (DUF302 family)